MFNDKANSNFSISNSLITFRLLQILGLAGVVLEAVGLLVGLEDRPVVPGCALVLLVILFHLAYL